MKTVTDGYDASMFRIYSYPPYAGNTSNQIIKGKVPCSRCGKLPEYPAPAHAFMSIDRNNGKTGYRFCPSCLNLHINMNFHINSEGTLLTANEKSPYHKNLTAA